MFKLPNTNFDFKRLLICKRVTISPVSLIYAVEALALFQQILDSTNSRSHKFCQLVNGNFNKQEISLKPLHERA